MVRPRHARAACTRATRCEGVRRGCAARLPRFRIRGQGTPVHGCRRKPVCNRVANLSDPPTSAAPARLCTDPSPGEYRRGRRPGYPGGQGHSNPDSVRPPSRGRAAAWPAPPTRAGYVACQGCRSRATCSRVSCAEEEVECCPATVCNGRQCTPPLMPQVLDVSKEYGRAEAR